MNQKLAHQWWLFLGQKKQIWFNYDGILIFIMNETCIFLKMVLWTKTIQYFLVQFEDAWEQNCPPKRHVPHYFIAPI